jgi:transposase-like protein
MGNKASSRTIYRPEYAEIAKNILAQGFSIASVCAEIGISRNQAYVWIKEKPDFAAAIEQGQELAQRFWETLLVSDATGTLPKSLQAKNSKGINTTAVIFALKTRFHKDYGLPEQQVVIQNNLTPSTSDVIKGLASDPEALAAAKKVAKALATKKD